MLIFQIRRLIREYFDLDKDKVENTEAVGAIVQGVQFKGMNLLILICAVFIASLGLNMNSTAVIIGAMLISPLMGPIMGIGLGFGIHDMPLIRRCAINLIVATIFALITSCVYFLLSPINDARSELLARTQPTIYDVLIAFFGGFAGIIATCSKSKGNILPGVAIATALMPPLCTAGYGLATLQWNFLAGAFYLFVINAVYIGLATWLGVFILKLPKVEAEWQMRRQKTWIVAIMIIVLTPSIFTTVGIIQDNVRDAHVRAFVHGEFDKMEKTQLMSYKYVENDSNRYIEVALLGEPLDDHKVDIIAACMKAYNIPSDCKLKVIQGSANQEADIAQVSGTIVQTMIQAYQEQILSLKQENDSLKHVISELQDYISVKLSKYDDMVEEEE
ncbi:MAG: DUF389 domain-containing protein [Bacteroidia bacterium]|nr:DUF389 domain-containing protein [Bacteroidia bacterium]